MNLLALQREWHLIVLDRIHRLQHRLMEGLDLILALETQGRSERALTARIGPLVSAGIIKVTDEGVLAVEGSQLNGTNARMLEAERKEIRSSRATLSKRVSDHDSGLSHELNEMVSFSPTVREAVGHYRNRFAEVLADAEVGSVIDLGPVATMCMQSLVLLDCARRANDERKTSSLWATLRRLDVEALKTEQVAGLRSIVLSANNPDWIEEVVHAVNELAQR